MKRWTGYITAIHDWFPESEISDLIVSVNLATVKSIDQALEGKHYRRSPRKFNIWSNLKKSDQSMG